MLQPRPTGRCRRRAEAARPRPPADRRPVGRQGAGRGLRWDPGRHRVGRGRRPGGDQRPRRGGRVAPPRWSATTGGGSMPRWWPSTRTATWRCCACRVSTDRRCRSRGDRSGQTGGVFGHPGGEPLRIAPFGSPADRRDRPRHLRRADDPPRGAGAASSTCAGRLGLGAVDPQGEVVGHRLRRSRPTQRASPTRWRPSELPRPCSTALTRPSVHRRRPLRPDPAGSTVSSSSVPPRHGRAPRHGAGLGADSGLVRSVADTSSGPASSNEPGPPAVTPSSSSTTTPARRTDEHGPTSTSGPARRPRVPWRGRPN